MSPARARVGVSLMFFTNGVLLAGLLPRFPEVKDAYGLSATAFGILVIAMPLGAMVAAATAGPFIRRFGARSITAIGSVLLAIAIAAAPHSPVAWGFAAIFFLAGAIDAIVDAAQNVQGVIVEQWAGKSIINFFHAIWSLGATTGGLVGTWCASQGIPLTTQLAANGAVWAVVAIVAAVLAATPHDNEHEAEQAPEAHSVEEVATAGPRPWRLLVPLIALAICGTLMEEVANSWSALFIDRETAAPDGLAGLGFTIVLAAQFVGRLVGDPMTDRWGREAVARAGGLLAAAGMALAWVGPSWHLVLVGFGLMGFGCATLVPAAFAAAARVPGLAHGTGVAVLGWGMRLGFLLTSPVIGVISDTAGLRHALLVPLAAGLVAAWMAGRLRGATT
ncbi:MAG: MFS transporter [Mobilicoccus sp.]|nr:MFS transporter [Mobilicoccus sp.]